MPELPEVETIRASLLPHVIGARIVKVVVRDRRLRRPLPADFEGRLSGSVIESVERCGKYLLFGLGKRGHLLVHLGMSGRLELRGAGVPALRHDHVRLRLDAGRVLVLNDARRFGLMRVGAIDEFVELRNVGPDPLNESWDAQRLRQLVRHRRLPIKNLLMDQRTIGGIGNIYANEMLHRAGIRPRRRADRLRQREFEALAVAMREVLTDAVRLGGSSISDFRDSNGRPGYFQLKLAVYDRAGKPCPRCGVAVRRIVLSGRSSFYCPQCQR